MSAREVLLQAAGRKLIDVDGEEQTVSLQPPASPARIAEIERELGFALPRELAPLESAQDAAIPPGRAHHRGTEDAEARREKREEEGASGSSTSESRSPGGPFPCLPP